MDIDSTPTKAEYTTEDQTPTMPHRTQENGAFDLANMFSFESSIPAPVDGLGIGPLEGSPRIVVEQLDDHRQSGESTTVEGRPDFKSRARGRSSVGPAPPPKDRLLGSASSTSSGSDYGHESPSHPPLARSQPFGDLAAQIDSQAQLGYGPPPKQVMKGFKMNTAFGRAASVHSVDSKDSLRPKITKPKSMWPSAMSFHDVLAEQTSLARGRGYAVKINELLADDCGLADWIYAMSHRRESFRSADLTRFLPSQQM